MPEKFSIEAEFISETYEVKNGKKVKESVQKIIETETNEYDDAITFIKAICDEANKARVKGYIPKFTFDADSNKVIVRQIKSKQ